MNSAKRKDVETRIRLQEETKALGRQTAHACKWMFGDAGRTMGSLGKKLSHYNPARWSRSITCREAIDQLEVLANNAAPYGQNQRPIVLKMPARMCTRGRTYETIDEAIDKLRTHADELAQSNSLLRATQVAAKNH